MTDFGREGQVVDDCADFGCHSRVVFQVENLELLCTHQTISDFLDSIRAKACVLQIKLTDLTEVCKDFTYGLRIIEAEILTREVKGEEVRMGLHAREEVVTWASDYTKHLVNLQLLKLSSLLSHVVHALKKELEEVRPNMDTPVAVELDDS